MTPAVSVLLPVRDGARYLPAAIASVQVQEGVAWELVIVDDGSRDESGAIAAEYAARDPRIHLLRASGLGVAGALNLALRHARGRFVARLDADDLMAPERLQRQCAWLEAHPDHVLLATTAVAISPAGEVIGPIGRPAVDAELRRRLRVANVIIHPSVCIAAGALRAVGGWDPRWEGCEDYALWLALLGCGRARVLDFAGIRYRLHPQQVTARRWQRIAAIEATLGCSQLALTGQRRRRAWVARYLRNLRWQVIADPQQLAVRLPVYQGEWRRHRGPAREPARLALNLLRLAPRHSAARSAVGHLAPWLLTPLGVALGLRRRAGRRRPLR